MKSLLVGSALALLAMASVASAADVSACLITKTDTNPFFVKMREGAEAAAAKAGVQLQSFAGKVDGDHEGQVAAIESCIASGAKGILITPSDTSALVPTIKKARDAGILVIALDTPLNPIDAADATFATDNFHAGELIGAWARATLGDRAKDAKIALLDSLASQPTVDVLRDQGFLTGFGIDTKDIAVNGDEDDPRIVGNDLTSGTEEGGMGAMENLLAKDSGINLVYAINEAAASGAYAALSANGRAGDVMIVTIDGGCPGVKAVSEGTFAATSQQYPLRMAALGIEAIAQFAKDGTIPKPTEGRNFFDTGATLVTDHPAAGVDSIDAKKGLELCWG